MASPMKLCISSFVFIMLTSIIFAMIITPYDQSIPAENQEPRRNITGKIERYFPKEYKLLYPFGPNQEKVSKSIQKFPEMSVGRLRRSSDIESEGLTCADSPCAHGTCTDEADGYFCTCELGWIGKNCDVEDFCRSQPCLHGSECVSQDGKQMCTCAEGFDGEICQHNINECWSNPCQNDAMCIDGVNRYHCDCKDGWAGTLCSEDINECASSPCYNGARCATPRIGIFQCQCVRGFYGINCENDIKECLSFPCLNNGNCIDLTNSFVCKCASGFNGKFCETEIDECEADPCQNGGSCIDEVNRFSCQCKDGFGGILCDENINECENSPCENEGECVDEEPGFSCVCSTGWQGKLCENDINECASSPCLNNGLCQQLEVGAYRCSCSNGYTGRHCETDINDCRTNPCRNKGRCEDKVGSVKCICPPGFDGEFCERDIDECASEPCQNGAICLDMDAEFECVCEDGYVGSFCQIDVNECASYPCRNGGQCVDEVNSFSCICVSGYIGRTCEVNVNECTSQPCKNNGRCVDGIAKYTCECASGYKGATCQEQVDECAGMPCLNGASCRDQINGFACSCSPGYVGERCEKETNECSSLPCSNGGKCVDIVNAYACECMPGYSGNTCEINIKECDSSPCLNGGTCLDGRNSYRCECPSSYEGLICEKEIKQCNAHSCMNDGECIEEEDSFTCECKDGFEGQRCQINVDECIDNSCENGGVCIDGVNDFRCICRDKYQGKNCNDSTEADAEARKQFLFSLIPSGSLLILGVIIVITLGICFKSGTGKATVGDWAHIANNGQAELEPEKFSKHKHKEKGKAKEDNSKTNGHLKTEKEHTSVTILNGKTSKAKSKRKSGRHSHISSTLTSAKTVRLAEGPDENDYESRGKERKGHGEKGERRKHHRKHRSHHREKEEKQLDSPELIELQDRINLAENRAKKISDRIQALQEDAISDEKANDILPDNPVSECVQEEPTEKHIIKKEEIEKEDKPVTPEIKENKPISPQKTPDLLSPKQNERNVDSASPLCSKEGVELQKAFSMKKQDVETAAHEQSLNPSRLQNQQNPRQFDPSQVYNARDVNKDHVVLNTAEQKPSREPFNKEAGVYPPFHPGPQPYALPQYAISRAYTKPTEPKTNFKDIYEHSRPNNRDGWNRELPVSSPYMSPPNGDVIKPNIRSPWEPVWDDDTVKKMNSSNHDEDDQPHAQEQYSPELSQNNINSPWQPVWKYNYPPPITDCDVNTSLPIHSPNQIPSRVFGEKTFQVYEPTKRNRMIANSNSKDSPNSLSTKTIKEGTVYENIPIEKSINSRYYEALPLPGERSDDVSIEDPSYPGQADPHKTYHKYKSSSPLQRSEPAYKLPMNGYGNRLHTPESKSVRYSRYFPPTIRNTQGNPEENRETISPLGVSNLHAYQMSRNPISESYSSYPPNPNSTHKKEQNTENGRNSYPVQKRLRHEYNTIGNSNEILLPPPPTYSDAERGAGLSNERNKFEMYRTSEFIDNVTYQNDGQSRYYPNDFGLKNPLGMNRENAFLKHH